MSEWVRLLNQITSSSAEWHVPLTKSFTTTTYCGRELAGPLEVASADKAEREGRCSPCVTTLAATQGTLPQRASRPMAQERPSPVQRAPAKKAAAKTMVTKPAPKGRSGKAPVGKHPLRRSRRGKT